MEVTHRIVAAISPISACRSSVAMVAFEPPPSKPPDKGLRWRIHGSELPELCNQTVRESADRTGAKLHCPAISYKTIGLVADRRPQHCIADWLADCSGYAVARARDCCHMIRIGDPNDL